MKTKTSTLLRFFTRVMILVASLAFVNTTSAGDAVGKQGYVVAYTFDLALMGNSHRVNHTDDFSLKNRKNCRKAGKDKVWGMEFNSLWECTTSRMSNKLFNNKSKALNLLIFKTLENANLFIRNMIKRYPHLKYESTFTYLNAVI